MAEGSATDGWKPQFHKLPSGLDQVFREYNCVGSFFDELSASLRERGRAGSLETVKPESVSTLPNAWSPDGTRPAEWKC